MTDRNIPTDDNLKKKENEKKKRKSTTPPYGGSKNTEKIRHDISHEINFPPLKDTPVIFSSQKIGMDDLTSRGMETRTGVPKDCLALLWN
jgi:hypothetical protein